jgi:hypothetical protein
VRAARAPAHSKFPHWPRSTQNSEKLFSLERIGLDSNNRHTESSQPCRLPAKTRHVINLREIVRSRKVRKGPRLVVTDLLKYFARSQAAKLLKVKNHMHLIEVAKMMGYGQPRSLWRLALCIERRLETNQPGEEFWTESDLSCESPFILPKAQGTIICKVLNPDRSVAAIGVLGRLHDQGSWQSFACEGQQIFLCDPNPLFKRVLLGQAQPKNIDTISQEISSVPVLVCEDSRRYSKQLP